MFVPSETVPAVQLLRVVRYRWKLVTALVLAPALLGLLYALVSARRYEAEVVVLPRTQDRSGLLSSLGSQLGGLAALAGLGLNESSQRAEAIQMLQSQVLTRQFIQDHQLMPVLFPGDWDAQNQRWRRKPPSINDAVNYFNHGIRTVVEDRRTGLVTIRIVWRDPLQAAAWANDLVRRANDDLRQRAVARAQSSIEYLKREAHSADAVEIQQTLYRLMEEQYKTLLLANGTTEYAFSIIDPAVAADPDRYVSPRAGLYTFAGLFLGTVLAAIAVFLGTPPAPRQGSQGLRSP